MSTDSATMKKTKVAVLGGGPAGLATAFALTATEELRQRFDVTIYQSGWRVGGKCGQGRSGPANRIEINGTHYLFGAYDTVFALARDIFAELDAAHDKRFGTFDSQFLPCSTVAVKDFFNGNWTTWVIDMPGNGKVPGTPGGLPSLGDTIRTILDHILDATSDDTAAELLNTSAAAAPKPAAPPVQPPWWERIAEAIEGELHGIEHYVGLGLARLAHELAAGLEREATRPAVKKAIVWLLTELRAWAWSLLGDRSATHLEAHRLLTLIDLGTTVLIGMIEDDVLAEGGFDRIDGLDLREWIAKWGAHESTVWSAPVTTWYNAIAAYADGNIDTPDMSAGMGLRGMLRLGLTYKGAFSFQLSYEVGDSIIAPLYQVLKNRGVKFMYFHRVRALNPSADGTTIESVTVERQVNLKSGDPASYDPFMLMPDGRPVWPDAPLVDQIAMPPVNAADLLSFYAPAVGTTVELRRGLDFDAAVFAIPVAAARWYCAELMKQKPAWRDMVDNLGTTETQSLRLWLYPTVEQMGWPYGQAVLSGYYQPLATWEDARQLVAAESWPKDRTPGGIATLFGAFPGAPTVYPDPGDAGYPIERAAAATQTAFEFCQSLVGPLWPNATALTNPVGLDLAKLVTLDASLSGPARILAQSIRANIGPVEAYTQIHKGTLKYRLAAGQSGYANLMLAGDWVRNGYEIGSVEGAVLGGLQAAQAIIGT